MTNFGNRIVILIDMDCFYCQVETRLQPDIAGKPLAVVQYNQWKLGGIIAVNYEARDFGVTRHMRGEEAKLKCPELLLVSVPCLRGKADTSKYRSAGREVIEVLKKNCNIIERASVDEAYLDITQIVDDKLANKLNDYEDVILQLKNTFIVGHSESGVNNEEERSKGLETWLSTLSIDTQVQRLSIAGAFVENLRKEIYETTGFKCSAGISFNKILAKLACGLHKPNRQTILSSSAIPHLFSTLPIKKVRNLGGKLGDIVIDSLQCNVMSDLLHYSLSYLQNHFDEKTGLRLYNIARGIDNEPVTPRLVSKSIGACKNFPGKLAIVDKDFLKHWLSELSAEVCERLEQDLEENERKASLLTVSFHYYQNKTSVSQSRSCPLTSYKPEKISEQCFNLVTKATHQPISFLGISTSKFIKAKGSENFINFFKSNATDNCTSISNTDISEVNDNLKTKNSMNVNCNKTERNEKHKISNDYIINETTKNKNLESSSVEIKQNKTSSPCSIIQHSLKSDNFKKSFFMNILTQEKLKTDHLNSITNTREHDFEIHDCNTTSNEDLRPNNNDNIKNSSENITKKSDKKKQKSSMYGNDETTIGIEEIFPDLNDIDINIVRLLPSHLQQEVKKLLKTTEVHEKNVTLNKAIDKKINKNSKGKLFKSKSQNKKSNIETFFINTAVNNDLKEFKKCPQCHQLIVINKFDEHNDYHIAATLQKEINQNSDNVETRKRKVITNNSNHLKKRVNDQIVTYVSKTKSGSSFFQQ
ncbi:PREDICTED: DNA polymerase eta [Ceratosolen solmsi marchali]|uniref:DNA polymerase eta n=1 Tax=Ceratosolen solmsi marchali TaxID=326594 RepID=A0AAJ7DVC3_9HYME|nr:PREDICTED: DNA polymerase eta [Ceratosolen solmsi marchali]